MRRRVIRKFLAAATLVALATPAIAQKLPIELNAKIVKAEGAGGGSEFM